MVPKHLLEGTELAQPRRAQPVQPRPHRHRPLRLRRVPARRALPADAPTTTTGTRASPYLDEIVFQFLPDAATEGRALETGDIHLTAFSAIPLLDLAARRRPRRRLRHHRGLRGPHLRDHARLQPPQRDPRRTRTCARPSAWRSTRRSSSTRSSMGYGATAATGPVPETDPTFYTPDVTTYAFDPAAAEALLDAAGYPRGDDGTRFALRLRPAPVLRGDARHGRLRRSRRSRRSASTSSSSPRTPRATSTPSTPTTTSTWPSTRRPTATTRPSRRPSCTRAACPSRRPLLQPVGLRRPGDEPAHRRRRHRDRPGRPGSSSITSSSSWRRSSCPSRRSWSSPSRRPPTTGSRTWPTTRAGPRRRGPTRGSPLSDLTAAAGSRGPARPTAHPDGERADGRHGLARRPPAASTPSRSSSSSRRASSCSSRSRPATPSTRTSPSTGSGDAALAEQLRQALGPGPVPAGALPRLHGVGAARSTWAGRWRPTPR